MTQYLKDFGERLAELGYRVVPLPPGSKGPHKKNWQKLSATPEQIKSWYTNGSANDGVGILAATTPAIDVDVMDPAIAQRMSDEIDRIFAGQPLMTRTGRAPKFLIPFRSDNPFRKITSTTYTDGANEHRIEILGDGQQWVAYHTHPSTGKPYEWFDGISDVGIRDVEQSSLPVLTESLARMVVDAFESIAAEEVAAGRWKPKSQVKPDRPVVSSDDPFAAHIAPTGVDVPSLLAKIPNDDCDYDRWFTVLAAVHHETAGAGRETAYQWSSASSKHTDERFDTTWNSLGRTNARPVTLRTLLKEAKPVAPRKDPVERLSIHNWADYQQGFESIPWIVDDVLPQAEFGILFGASGSGKTFFSLDLACRIARGQPWRGHDTTQTRVVYLAAEAGEGIKKRMRAFDLEYGTSDQNPDILVGIPDLMTMEDAAFINEIIGKAGLIIIDTMAASQTGEENSSRDMGLFITHCKAISTATGAMVLVVHHTGKDDTKGARGSSALYAAADVVLEIYKAKEGNAVQVVKQKDGETGKSYGFRLDQIRVGSTPNGKHITSCVVVPMEDAPSKKSSTGGDFDTSKLYTTARAYLATLWEMTGGESVNVMLDEFLDALVVSAEGDGRKLRKGDAAKTTETIVRHGRAAREGPWIKPLKV